MNIYKTHNVCSRSIEFEVENNIITACKFNRRLREQYAGCRRARRRHDR